MHPTKEKLKFLESEITRINKEIRLIKRTCTHNIVGKKDSSARCDICGSYFGWWCPESKDHVCHYESEHGIVELIDGTAVSVPKDHDPDYECDDWCIFCGNPEERK